MVLDLLTAAVVTRTRRIDYPESRLHHWLCRSAVLQCSNTEQAQMQRNQQTTECTLIHKKCTRSDK